MHFEMQWNFNVILLGASEPSSRTESPVFFCRGTRSRSQSPTGRNGDGNRKRAREPSTTQPPLSPQETPQKQQSRSFRRKKNDMILFPLIWTLKQVKRGHTHISKKNLTQKLIFLFRICRNSTNGCQQNLTGCGRLWMQSMLPFTAWTCDHPLWTLLLSALSRQMFRPPKQLSSMQRLISRSRFKSIFQNSMHIFSFDFIL